MRQLNLPTAKKQQGLTAIGWLLVLGVLGFFVIVILKMLPIYNNYFKLQTVLESLGNEQGIYTMSERDLHKLIDKRNNINMVDKWDPKYLVIELKQSGAKELHFRYEDRRELFSNIDVVVKFDEYITVTRQGLVESD
jgi:hypothetical protein